MKTDPETIARHYSADDGSDYSAWQLRTARQTARVVAANFTPFIAPSDSVLDFGCGGGGVISEIVCAHRFGVEPNPASRIVASERNVVCEENLARFADSMADVVISNHALEHCLNPFRELSEIRRVLKAGGTFALIVPSEEWRAQRHFVRGDRNHHLFTWTPLLIGNLIEEAGFDVDSVRLKRSAWPPGVRFLTWLPKSAFRLMCGIWSRLTLSQEIVVVARRPRE